MEKENVLFMYETHVSVKTEARSSFAFHPEPLTYPLFVGGGTHKKYLVLLRKGTKVVFTRTSNRGNVDVKEFIVEKPMFIDFLGFTGDIEPKYFALAKERGLL